MKSKKTYQIPDSYYSYFGIYVSGTEKQDDMALFPDAPGKFFSESDRIVTLARESRLKSYFPVLRKIDLLSLNYPSLPRNPSQRAGYVKKVIRSSLKKLSTPYPMTESYAKPALILFQKSFILPPDLYPYVSAARMTMPPPGWSADFSAARRQYELHFRSLAA